MNAKSVPIVYSRCPLLSNLSTVSVVFIVVEMATFSGRWIGYAASTAWPSISLDLPQHVSLHAGYII